MCKGPKYFPQIKLNTGEYWDILTNDNICLIQCFQSSVHIKVSTQGLPLLSLSDQTDWDVSLNKQMIAKLPYACNSNRLLIAGYDQTYPISCYVTNPGSSWRSNSRFLCGHWHERLDFWGVLSSFTVILSFIRWLVLSLTWWFVFSRSSALLFVIIVDIFTIIIWYLIIRRQRWIILQYRWKSWVSECDKPIVSVQYLSSDIHVVDRAVNIFHYNGLSYGSVHHGNVLKLLFIILRTCPC